MLSSKALNDNSLTTDDNSDLAHPVCVCFLFKGAFASTTYIEKNHVILVTSRDSWSPRLSFVSAVPMVLVPLCGEPGGPGRALCILASPVELGGCRWLYVALKNKL